METVKDMLSGVYPPITTPFTNDDINYKALIENIKKLNETDLRGYFVCGTNGEFKSLSVDERLKIIETAVEAASSNKIIMAGTAAESTKETIEITKNAANLGAQLASLLVPSFFKKIIDDEVIVDYIIEVADASPIPILIYNNPSVTGGVLVGTDVIHRISSHPNVVGMKDSSKGNFKGYIDAAHESFSVLAGSAGFFLELLESGGVGGVVSLANVFPTYCAELYKAFTAGDKEKARSLNEALVDLNKKVSGKYAVTGVKAAMDIVGFYGGNPRKPLRPLSAEARLQLKQDIESSELFNRR